LELRTVTGELANFLMGAAAAAGGLESS